MRTLTSYGLERSRPIRDRRFSPSPDRTGGTAGAGAGAQAREGRWSGQRHPGYQHRRSRTSGPVTTLHGMLIGAHVREDDPVATAAERGADIVQMFLADPQGWKKPPTHPQAEQLRGGAVPVVVHSPYVVNLASTNNRIRIPSRKLVVQHADGAAEVGAIGLVVHGGHVTAGEDVGTGVDNWRKFVQRQQDVGGFAVPVFIENTAGGD